MFPRGFLGRKASHIRSFEPKMNPVMRYEKESEEGVIAYGKCVTAAFPCHQGQTGSFVRDWKQKEAAGDFWKLGKKASGRISGLFCKSCVLCLYLPEMIYHCK